MYQIDFTKPIHIHFIGIGGISMSGLASILLDQKFKVSGSDAKGVPPLTKWMEQEGATVYYGQKASNIEDEPTWLFTRQPFTRTIRSSPLR